MFTLLDKVRKTLFSRWVYAVSSVVLSCCVVGSRHVQAVLMPPSHDCPAAIPRHPGSTYYAGTVTVHAGMRGDCVVKLPGGVILRAGGGSAPNKPAARAIFRINGAGIDEPGGLNILVSSSPVPSSSVPDFDPLRLPAHLTLPRHTVVVRWDPSSGRWAPQSSALQAWALYKVVRRGVALVQPAAVSPPMSLPATGLGTTAVRAGIGGLLFGALGLSDLEMLSVALLLIVLVLALLWRDVRRGVQPGASSFWTRLLLAFIAVVTLVLAALHVWTGYAEADQPQYGDIMAQGVAPTKPAALTPPERLTLSRLGIDTPVVPTTIVNQTWQVANYSAGYLPLGVRPGGRGNLAIAGHDDAAGAVFSRLDRAREGDVVSVYAGGATYRYHVAALRIVSPAQTSVLGPTSGAVLTLITCTPRGVDTQRLVIRATLIP